MAEYDRRLSDKILIAFYQACEQRDVEVARPLLDLLEVLWRRERGDAPERRHGPGFILAARLRFQHLSYRTRGPVQHADRDLKPRDDLDGALGAKLKSDINT